MQLNGLFIPLVTIFERDDGPVDYRKIEEHAAFLLEKGVDGFIPLGSTGDFYALSPDEKERVLKSVVSAVKGRCPVIAGTSALTTKECIDNCRMAEANGAAAVMVAPPFYLPLSDDEICGHYEAVSRSITIPIMLYNNPLCTGQNVTPSLIARLNETIHLGYVKESSGNIDAFQNILQKTGGTLHAFMGEESLAVQGLFLGAAGLVMGLGNGIPEVYTALRDLMRKGLFEEARALHLKMLPLYAFASRMHEFGYNSVAKSIIKLRGRGDVTSTRRPILPLTREQEKDLEGILEESGLMQG
jgi:4-hydroxy-tetrahydrodipicolinate synthase